MQYPVVGVGFFGRESHSPIYRILAPDQDLTPAPLQQKEATHSPNQ